MKFLFLIDYEPWLQFLFIRDDKKYFFCFSIHICARDLWRENLKVVIIKIFGTSLSRITMNSYCDRRVKTSCHIEMIKKHFNILLLFSLSLAPIWNSISWCDDFSFFFFFFCERAARMKNCWMITRLRTRFSQKK